MSGWRQVYDKEDRVKWVSNDRLKDSDLPKSEIVAEDVGGFWMLSMHHNSEFAVLGYPLSTKKVAVDVAEKFIEEHPNP